MKPASCQTRISREATATPGSPRVPSQSLCQSRLGSGESAVTTDQVLLGVGLIVVLAVGSQVLAARLRIPALIILLPAGFIAGVLTSDVNPEKLFGAAFQPLVSLAVAVILYDAGLGLELAELSDLLFLVRANGVLAPVTQTATPPVQEGDTMILLSPATADS